MRILTLSNLYPPHGIGGYEIRCRDAVERLIARGHEIRVLTSDHRVSGRADIEEARVRRELRIHGFYGHPWLPIHRLHALEAHNHRCLQAQLDEFRPDLVHVWNLGGISKSLLHRLQREGVPTAIDISDHWIARSLKADVWMSWWNEPGSLPRQSLRRALEFTGLRRRIDRLVPTASARELRFPHINFCSAYMRDHTAAQGWPVSHGSVIHCGIDSGAFARKTDHSRFEKLLWVGRLAPDKDPLTAVRALAAAHAKGLRGLTLDLVGHGDADFTAEVDAEIDRLGLGSAVRRRSVPSDEMRSIYSAHDALLFTSNWGEPFALTPLEAMASGLPVISTTDGGQVELARDRENCLIARAADPDDFATRIAELAADAALRASLAATGLKEARETYDLEPVTDRVEAFLREACASGQGSPPARA